MTDGIIQKVFSKSKEQWEKEFVPTTHFGLEMLFDSLQQELIDKIKQFSCPICEQTGKDISDYHVIRKIDLIGDSNE